MHQISVLDIYSSPSETLASPPELLDIGDDPDNTLTLLFFKLSSKNSIELNAETKESTRKTEEKLNGRYKEGHGRKKPK
jgi:hypothetical protein